ncbi:unnamed protein product, partial [Medioppia subpectinata]
MVNEVVGNGSANTGSAPVVTHVPYKPTIRYYQLIWMTMIHLSAIYGLYLSVTVAQFKSILFMNFLAFISSFGILLKRIIASYIGKESREQVPRGLCKWLRLNYYSSMRTSWRYATTSTLTESGAGLAPGMRSDVSLLRPTVMICVPLMLDRILKDMGARLTTRSPLAVPMFTHLMAYKSYWTDRGYRCPIVDKLVCDKLRQQMGGALRVAIVGAAPLSPTTQATLRAALDIALLQVYGTTETTGCVFAMDHDDLSISRVGAPLQGMRIKLIDWEEGGYYRSDRPNPRGEIVIGGNSVVTEYYKLPEQTREAFRTDDRGCRWFYTGDIGEIFPDGTIGIIDRRKDLLKLQSGRYVSLG